MFQAFISQSQYCSCTTDPGSELKDMTNTALLHSIVFSSNSARLENFADEVYMVLQSKTKDAVLVLIEKERTGEQVDRTMLKNVLGIFIELGMGSMENYQNDFESFLLVETANFYQVKAAKWIAVSFVLLCNADSSFG